MRAALADDDQFRHGVEAALAAGIDYGWLALVPELQELSELERMLLSDSRLYHVVAKATAANVQKHSGDKDDLSRFFVAVNAVAGGKANGADIEKRRMSPALTAPMASAYRSAVMRASFLSQDRHDIGEDLGCRSCRGT